MRILVVEDNERSLKLFSVILRQMGHEIQTAGDGERYGIDLGRHFV